MKENLNQTNQENKIKNKKGFFKYVSFKTLIILVVMLSFNAYAWFVFATKASVDLTVHVNSWNIKFKNGDEEITERLNIVVDKLYPGMDQFSYEVNVTNLGDAKATLKYSIKEFSIFDEYYKSGEDGYTDEMIENKVLNDYPFKVYVNLDQNVNTNNDGLVGIFSIIIDWPYERGENQSEIDMYDEIDTLFGEKAYQFYNMGNSNEEVRNTGNEIGMHLVVELTAEQNESQD